VQSHRAGTGGDTLLLLEHPPVVTLGRGAKAFNVLAGPEQLAAQGVSLVHTDRGGDVTYHGPGQIVGYPVLHLGPGQQDVRKYVRNLEEVLLRALAAFGITAHREAQWPGVWVQDSKAGGLRKIAALGVHLSRWYTRHGFALNVSPQLSHFELIVPCGIREAGVTSMELELGRAVPLPEVEQVLIDAFAAVFQLQPVPAPPRQRTVSVVVRDDGGRVLLLRRAPHRHGFWQQVTGKVEPGEQPTAAAARELREETGLAARVEALGYQHSFALGGSQPPRLIEETAFVARVAPGSAPNLSAEHDAWEWLDASVAQLRVPFSGLRKAIALAAKHPG
jgi:lipoyl(octanoyl) transferase